MARKQNRFKYPKLAALAVTIAFAVILFYEARHYAPFHDFLVSLGYVGTFFCGILYAFGFTSAPATAILLVIAKEQSFLTALAIAGMGALLGDALIYLFIKHSFSDELHKLKRERVMRQIVAAEKKMLGRYYRHIFPAFAGILIASPLPTEMGVTMMASAKKISMKKFLVLMRSIERNPAGLLAG
jgi:hypothetical protein